MATVELSDIGRVVDSCHGTISNTPGTKFYDLHINTGTLTLRRQPWTVNISGPFTPLMHGQVLQWQIA